MCTQWLQNDALAKTKTTEKLDIDQVENSLWDSEVIVYAHNTRWQFYSALSSF
tara:strand:+ start:2097 stop:2255 length:159 start_codon:yes stop_codon:yes gene_type:complete